MLNPSLPPHHGFSLSSGLGLLQLCAISFPKSKVFDIKDPFFNFNKSTVCWLGNTPRTQAHTLVLCYNQLGITERVLGDLFSNECCLEIVENCSSVQMKDMVWNGSKCTTLYGIHFEHI